VRLFVALNLPAELREALQAATATLREAAPREVTWARAEALHLTLKFLGEADAGRVPEIAAAIGEVAARHQMASLRVGGVGAFPSLARPRVLWLGVEPTPRLELLQHDVEVACARLGFEVEGRPFRPHLTLGRLRAAAAPEAAARLAHAAAACVVEGETLVPAVDLMESTLMQGGPRHVVRASLPLREERDVRVHA
jgi:RNA 2',3'-cyclic 3'-phosphodiesterase